MKALTILALAALALANPIGYNLEPRADECATTCKKTYTLCYNFCNDQQILNGSPCARLCNVRSCKEVSVGSPLGVIVFV